MNKIPAEQAKHNRNTIQILANEYARNQRRLKEASQGYFGYSMKNLDAANYIVNHMNAVAMSLKPEYRLIIVNEVLYQKTGTWYLEYYSSSSYYRIRQKAYATYLIELNR